MQKIDLGAEFMAIMTFESKEGSDFSKATVHVEAAVASTAFSSTYNDEIRTASSDSTLRIEFVQHRRLVRAAQKRS